MRNTAIENPGCFTLYIFSGSQGAGTNDEVLIEILASRTGEEIKEITKAYKKGEFHSAMRGEQIKEELMFVAFVFW